MIAVDTSDIVIAGLILVPLLAVWTLAVLAFASERRHPTPKAPPRKGARYFVFNDDGTQLVRLRRWWRAYWDRCDTCIALGRGANECGPTCSFRAPATATPTSPGAKLIATERQRQIESEGWTPEHDDQHDGYELSAAARCYTMAAEATEYDTNCITFDRFRPGERPPWNWPWHPSWWKPSTSAIRNLVKAGALIAAEIDRLQRREDAGHGG